MPRELEIDETDLTKSERYLLGVGTEAGKLAQTLNEVAQTVAQAQKDKRPAYTNPGAAANIKNHAKETLIALRKAASDLIKKYGPTMKAGLEDVMSRLYTNFVNADGYLKLPGPQREIKQQIYSLSKAIKT